MSKKFTSTTEEVQTAMTRLEYIQFRREELDRQYAAQFNALFVLVASLPHSEEQKMIYDSLYPDDCSKRKKENKEEQNFDSNKR
jgi:hypothetical protein